MNATYCTPMKFTTIFLLFLSATCSAQMLTGPTDSLKKALGSAKDDTSAVWTLLRLVNATFTSNPDEAETYADEALQRAEKAGWKKGVAMAYKVKGGIAYVRSDFNRSLEFSQQSLKNDPGDNPMFRVGVMNNIANIYQEYGQYDKLLPVYHENLIIATRNDHKDEILFANYGLGTTFHLMKKPDSAVFYLEKAVLLAKESGNERLLGSALCALSVVKREQQKYEESAALARQSIGLAKQQDNKYIIAPALQNLAAAHYHMGNYDQAKEAAIESKKVAEELNSVEWQYEAWETLYKIYEKKNNIEQAFEAYKQFATLKDSALGAKKKQELVRLEVQFEADKKEAILNSAHEAALKRQQLQRNIWIGSGISLALLALLLFFFYKRKRDAFILQQETQLRAEIAETEMKALRLQMNPHFIFNSLNSISDYISRNDISSADDFLVRFGRLMRQTLEYSEQKEITLSEELDALNNYMQLEALRMENRFEYSITVDPSVNPDNTFIIPLLLQPFVENSIWHGVAHLKEKGRISITITRQESDLLCIVEDNGVGFSKDQQPRNDRKSYGLKVTESRLAIFNKTKNVSSFIKYPPVEKGMRVEIVLPFENND